MSYYNDLITFIQENNTNWIDILSKLPYCVKAKQCPFKTPDGLLKYPELYLLCYDQILSTFKEPIVRACRGCIISVEDPNNVKTVCTPFYKFFNYGEVDNADEIDWNSAIPQEKLDGSLIKYFNYKDEWIWVTNNGWDLNVDIPISVISAFDEPETDKAKTFKDLIQYYLNSNSIDTTTLRLDEDLTYMFELISPKNRIVCDYPKTQLVLLGARNSNTYQEYNAEQLQLNTPELKVFPRPEYFTNNSLDVLIDICKSYKDSFHEGFVVCDKYFNRIKVKGEHYLELKGFKGELGFTNQRVLEAILDGSVDDIISVFPEVSKQIDKIKEVYLKYNEKIKSLANKGSKKYNEILMEVKDEKLTKKLYAEWVFKENPDNSKILFLASKAIQKDILNFINNQTYEQMLTEIEKGA